MEWNGPPPSGKKKPFKPHKEKGCGVFSSRWVFFGFEGLKVACFL